MTRRNPFDELEDLFDRMGRQFDEAGSLRDVAVDVTETDEEFVVTADLPGYDREEIDLTLDDRQLRIAAERDSETDLDEETEPGERYVRRERTHEAVARTVALPDDVVPEEVNATYRNGVLTVHLPKLSPDEDGGYEIEVE